MHSQIIRDRELSLTAHLPHNEVKQVLDISALNVRILVLNVSLIVALFHCELHV